MAKLTIEERKRIMWCDTRFSIYEVYSFIKALYDVLPKKYKAEYWEDEIWIENLNGLKIRITPEIGDAPGSPDGSGDGPLVYIIAKDNGGWVTDFEAETVEDGKWWLKKFETDSV